MQSWEKLGQHGRKHWVECAHQNVLSGDLTGGQWLRLHRPMKGVRVQFLAGKLRSHMPLGQNAKLKQHCNKSNTDFFKKKNVLSGLYDLTLLTCQIHPPPSCPGSIWPPPCPRSIWPPPCPGSIWPPPCPGSIWSWVRGLSAGERVFRHVWSWRPSAAADQQDIPRRGIFKQTSRSTTKSMSFRVRWLRFKTWFFHFG